MSILKEKGIVPQNSEEQAIQIFESLFHNSEGQVIPFTEIDCCKMALYISNYWKKYELLAKDLMADIIRRKREKAQSDGKDPDKVTTNMNSINGKIFELIISTLLYKKGIVPFYSQAKVAFVPNVYYDIILYTKDKNVICLTIKASTRERIKQADLEAVALRYVHRRSKTYLLTMSTKEANTQKINLAKGSFLGIDAIIDCNKEVDLKFLFKELEKCEFRESEQVETITGHLVKNQI